MDRRIGQQLERVRRGAIDVIDPRRRRAVGVERRTQRLGAGRRRGHAEVLRHAEERLFVRSREDRPGDGVVGERQFRPPVMLPTCAGCGRQHVVSEAQSLHQTQERPVGLGFEGAGDVLPVQRHDDLAQGHLTMSANPHQHAAATHGVGPGRQRDDAEMVVVVAGACHRRRRSRQDEDHHDKGDATPHCGRSSTTMHRSLLPCYAALLAIGRDVSPFSRRLPSPPRHAGRRCAGRRAAHASTRPECRQDRSRGGPARVSKTSWPRR